MDQKSSNPLQLLQGLITVCVTQALLVGVLLQLLHVFDSIAWKTTEDLDQQEDKQEDKCLVNFHDSKNTFSIHSMDSTVLRLI